MLRRRRKGATIRLSFNTNPEEILDDDLSTANLKQIHVQPPTGSEIILTATLDGWKLNATLSATQHVIEGLWQADAYAQFNAGEIIKIGKTVAWQTDAKYKYP